MSVDPGFVSNEDYFVGKRDEQQAALSKLHWGAAACAVTLSVMSIAGSVFLAMGSVGASVAAAWAVSPFVLVGAGAFVALVGTLAVVAVAVLRGKPMEEQIEELQAHCERIGQISSNQEWNDVLNQCLEGSNLEMETLAITRAVWEEDSNVDRLIQDVELVKNGRRDLNDGQKARLDVLLGQLRRDACVHAVVRGDVSNRSEIDALLRDVIVQGQDLQNARTLEDVFAFYRGIDYSDELSFEQWEVIDAFGARLECLNLILNNADEEWDAEDLQRSFESIGENLERVTALRLDLEGVRSTYTPLGEEQTHLIDTFLHVLVCVERIGRGEEDVWLDQGGISRALLESEKGGACFTIILEELAFAHIHSGLMDALKRRQQFVKVFSEGNWDFNRIEDIFSEMEKYLGSAAEIGSDLAWLLDHSSFEPEQVAQIEVLKSVAQAVSCFAENGGAWGSKEMQYFFWSLLSQDRAIAERLRDHFDEIYSHQNTSLDLEKDKISTELSHREDVFTYLLEEDREASNRMFKVAGVFSVFFSVFYSDLRSAKALGKDLQQLLSIRQNDLDEQQIVAIRCCLSLLACVEYAEETEESEWDDGRFAERIGAVQQFVADDQIEGFLEYVRDMLQERLTLKGSVEDWRLDRINQAFPEHSDS